MSHEPSFVSRRSSPEPELACSWTAIAWYLATGDDRDLQRFGRLQTLLRVLTDRYDLGRHGPAHQLRFNDLSWY
jgi:hypothetical protein